jgi:hypothetical protein
MLCDASVLSSSCLCVVTIVVIVVTVIAAIVVVVTIDVITVTVSGDTIGLRITSDAIVMITNDVVAVVAIVTADCTATSHLSLLSTAYSNLVNIAFTPCLHNLLCITDTAPLTISFTGTCIQPSTTRLVACTVVEAWQS